VGHGEYFRKKIMKIETKQIVFVLYTVRDDFNFDAIIGVYATKELAVMAYEKIKDEGIIPTIKRMHLYERHQDISN